MFMDRNIIHALMDEDLITSMVDCNDYNTVDELIDNGIVTIPGAKSRILEILDSLNVKPIEVNIDSVQDTIDEPTVEPEPIVLNDPIIDETPVTWTPIDETPVSDPVIDETPVTETPIDETPESEPAIEEVVETTVVEPADELVTTDITTDELKEAKGVKKSTKKTTKKTE
jgi:hypothetical protein